MGMCASWCRPSLMEDETFPITALMLAASRGDVLKVKKLLKAGADVNLTSRPGFGGITALVFAIEADSPEIVKILIDAGADANARCFCGFTVLINSLFRDYREVSAYGHCIRHLLAAGADPRVPSSFSSRDVMDYASEMENYVMIAELVRAGDRRWELVPIPCRGLEVALASSNGDDKVIREVLKRLETSVKESIIFRLKILRRILPEPELCLRIACQSF
jgi:hypothetical protein